MPTAFLSYARQNLPELDQLVQVLSAHGVTVWQDRERLHAGERWPKALGEAVAASDFLVLVWSAEASQSAFVELEWCTALALKKRVVPCLLDDTTLPDSLSAIQAVRLDEMPLALAKLLAEPVGQSSPPDLAEAEQIIRRMAEIRVNEPQRVLEQAKTIFYQNEWSVTGPVYQTTGDIHVTMQSSKRVFDTSLYWLGLLVLIAIVLVSQPRGPDAPTNLDQVPFENRRIITQVLAGSVWDRMNEPIPGVHLSLLLDGSEFTASTDGLGRFSFEVKARVDQEVILIAQKAGFRTERSYVRLGNPAFNFSMQRRQE